MFDDSQRESTDDDLSHGRQFIAESGKQLRHARHDVDRQERDHTRRRKQQKHRIRQRAANLSSQRDVASHVSHVTTQHFVERARSFTGENRSRVDSRKDSALRSKRLRQRRAAANLLFNFAQDGSQSRGRGAFAQHRDRLEDRNTGANECCELLVEKQKVVGFDARVSAAAAESRQSGDAGGLAEA